jgi:hypothetical protein
LLGTDDFIEISGKVAYREDAFGESTFQALTAVLANYGDRYVKVTCINGEWHGTKADLVSASGGIPKCPNGHVVLESSLQPRLGLIEE